MILTAIFLLSGINTAAAQPRHHSRPEYPDGPWTGRIVSIDSVVVSGRYIKEIVPAQVLSGDGLRRLNSHSVSDALRYFSGVQIKDYGGIGGLKTVNIRSMGSEHVGVFYDGIRIGNAQNGTVDLGRFSLDNMEVLSLYNGQKSDIFQSATDFASASAIYMVMRRPSFYGDRTDNLNFKVRAGSFDLINTSALWEHRYNGNAATSANLEFLNTSGKYKYRYTKDDGYDVRDTRRNGDLWYARAEGAAFGKINRGEWQLKGYFYRSLRGYPGAAVKKDKDIALLNEDRQRDRNFFFQGSVRQEVSPRYSFRVQAKYANDYMNYVMPETTTLQTMDMRYRQQEVYLTAANLVSITPWWSANIACDLKWNGLDAEGTEMFAAHFPQPRRYTVLGAAATSVTRQRFSVQGSVLYTYVTESSARGFATAGDKNVFSPTLIASYRPLGSTGLDIRAFYKEIFRLPTFNDLYYVQLGNRLLKPEYTTQYNVGVAYKKHFRGGWFAALDVSADAYYNEVKDKIVAIPGQSQLVWTMVNLGFVEVRGLDVKANPSFRFGEAELNVRLAYTYQRSQDMTREKDRDWGEGTVISTYGDQIPYIPRHSGTVVLNASYRTWDFNYSFIYTGERYHLGANIPVNYLQPWYTHDMSFSKKCVFGSTELRITGEVNNILNQYYDVVKWYPMPGTNFKIIISITL